MPQIKRRSFGIVPVAFDTNGMPIFLLLRAYGKWDFPKGGADPEEGPLIAALREMREETGIQDAVFEWGQLSMDTTIYATDKIATYFVARVEKKKIVLPISAELGHPEHDEYCWASANEARTLLSARLIPILDWAKGLLAKQ